MNAHPGAFRSRGRIPNPRSTLLICALLALAAAGALWLIFSTEPEVQREGAVREAAMLVEVIQPEFGNFRPEILALGTVRPAREVVLRPRVAGEIVALSPAFVPGGFVRAGEVLIRIDEADYDNALAQRQAELEQAIAELEIEHGRQDIAARDYRQLERELDPDKKALVLRRPQLRSADARVRSARAALDRARMDLERTVVTAPFDAQVMAREVNLGSQVSPGDPLARLVGLDTYWVETTIPLKKLRWLSFPDVEGRSGSPVTISHRTAWPEGRTRDGSLFTLVGELEGETRLARVLIAVNDPLARSAESDVVPGLIIGSFVECRIHGRVIEGAVRLNREHIRQGDTVWVMNGDHLAIRDVDIVFRDAEFAYVREGLSAGDRIVTTSLATVKEGVRLRLKSSSGPAAAPVATR